MVSAGFPSAPYAEACQAFMVGMISVRRGGAVAV